MKHALFVSVGAVGLLWVIVILWSLEFLFRPPDEARRVQL